MKEPEFEIWAAELAQTPPGSLAEAELFLRLAGWEAEWLARLPGLLPRLAGAALHPADPPAAERALLLLYRSGLRVSAERGGAFRDFLLRLASSPAQGWGRLLLLFLAEGRVEGGGEMLLECWEAWPAAEEDPGGADRGLLASLVRAAACHEARQQECSSRFVALATAEMRGHRLREDEREAVVRELARVGGAYRVGAFVRCLEEESLRRPRVMSVALPHLPPDSAERLFQHWRAGEGETVLSLLAGMRERGDWTLSRTEAAPLLGHADPRIRLQALLLLESPGTSRGEGAPRTVGE